MNTQIEVEFEGEVLSGVLIKEDKDYFTIKMDSGYNVNVRKSDAKVVSKKEIKKDKGVKVDVKKSSKDLPKISILHTGGTIASKVDYETGAVSSKFTPEELLAMYDELNDIANLSAKMISSLLSEDMNFNHYNALLSEIEKEIKTDTQGIIITHGTDTMHYTSAALQYACSNLPIPVILVGAQRSSDRPSSDAFDNLSAAVDFIIDNSKKDMAFRRCGICMHATNEDDGSFVILDGINAKKMHSSERDAFKQINYDVFASLSKDRGTIVREELLSDEPRDNFSFVKYDTALKIGFFKSHPNLIHTEIDALSIYDAVIVEGTGLGHLAVTEFDSFTKENPKNLASIKKLMKTTKVIIGTQTVYGSVNMNIYSSGRSLKESGVFGQNMNLTSETLFIRAAHCLSKDKKNFDKLWKENLEGFECRSIEIEK